MAILTNQTALDNCQAYSADLHTNCIASQQTTASATNNSFRRIGQGFCGTVWASSAAGDLRAIKREDGGPGRSLYNDYIMHQKIFEGLSTSGSRVRICVPVCHQYICSDDRTWWDEQISRFPKDFQIPCNALITNRIPPLPKSVRDSITDLYCPESLKLSTKVSEPDQDCLVRPYLGRRRRLVKQSRFQAFSLRNYPLHVDQMEDLELDSMLYARMMAEALADLYWRARVDANDVEFVLAPSPGQQSHTNTAHIIESHLLGDHIMWILDFDCCKPMSLDESGVQQAVVAFYKNDPFYPRPGRDNIKDQMLWNEFRDRFVIASEKILGRESPETRLPTLWVELVQRGGYY